MSKESVQPPSEKFSLYDKLLTTIPEIERKGKTMPYTSLNGNMFTYLSKEGSVGIRLPKEEREAFLEKYNTTLDEQYGSVMKEYVRVPDDLLEKTEELQAYLELSYAYVQSLKPKPTTKKKKK